MSIELKALIKRLEKDPCNLDLMNDVAMGYYQNPDMVSDDEDLKLFRKAYLTKKTVKTTNNLAWMLYMEYGKWEQALTIAKESVSLNPKSYFPYYLLGYIYLNEDKPAEALKYLQIAESKSDARNIVHNIGVAHYNLKNYEDAYDHFLKGSKLRDVENVSLYNLAVTCFALNRYDETKEILVALKNNLTNEFLDPVCEYELASVYAALEEYDKASELTVEFGIDGIDLLDWPDLAYSIYVTDPKLFDEKIAGSVKELKDWIIELQTDHEDWEEFSSNEKAERIEEFQLEIVKKESLKSQFEQKKPAMELFIKYENCGCLLFGCAQHNNPDNDG